MELKKQVTYKIPFRGKGAMLCGIFLAISIFFRCFHYFIPCDFSQINAGEWIFKIILPLLLCGAYAAIVRIVRLRSPGLYGILAASLCFVMFIGDLFDAKLIQIIISVLTMPALSVLLLMTFGGFISQLSISSSTLVLICLIRFVIWFFCKVPLAANIADISILLGLFCFAVSLNPCED